MGLGSIIKRKQVDIMKLKVLPAGHAGEIDLQRIVTEKQKIVVTRVRARMLEDWKIDFFNNSLARFDLVRNRLWQLIHEETKKEDLYQYLDAAAKNGVFEMMIQSMYGYGVLDSLMTDPSVTEITIDGVETIYFEKNGITQRATNKKGDPIKFDCVGDLLYVIEKIISPAGRKIDEGILNFKVRLPNGFRVNVALNQRSAYGHILTIRKPAARPYSMEQLVKFGMLTNQAADFLQKVVEAKCNVIICGETGSGKTTLLNAMSMSVPSNSKIIAIEEMEELLLTGKENLIRLNSHKLSNKKNDEITPQDIIRTAVSMRPDRLLVSEVQGGESYELIRAMNTGQTGVLFTGEASSSVEMIRRLEAMAFMSEKTLPLLLVRRQISSAINIIVHIGKLQNGLRRVFQITEVFGSDTSGYRTQDIFKFVKRTKNGEETGELAYTGVPVNKIGRFITAGIDPVSMMTHYVLP